jgi:hypothetical protein
MAFKSLTGRVAGNIERIFKMQIYQPTQYEQEAFDWAIKFAPDHISQAIISGIDYFHEMRAEVGPNIDECAQNVLESANKHLKADYQKVNQLWANSYRRSFGSDNS